MSDRQRIKQIHDSYKLKLSPGDLIKTADEVRLTTCYIYDPHNNYNIEPAPCNFVRGNIGLIIQVVTNSNYVMVLFSGCVGWVNIGNIVRVEQKTP